MNSGFNTSHYHREGKAASTYLVPVDKESKGEEDDYERKENGGDHRVYESKEEIQLQGWKVLPKSDASGIHCPLPVPLRFHDKHVFQMVYDQWLHPKNLVRDTSPAIDHYVSHEKCSFHWYSYSNGPWYSGKN